MIAQFTALTEVLSYVAQRGSGEADGLSELSRERYTGRDPAEDVLNIYPSTA